MNCVLRTLKCALWGEPCFFCCCKNVKESTATRFSYSVILVIVVILSTASHEGGLSGMLHSKYKEDIGTLCNFLNAGVNCTRFTGYIGIYRLCLPLFIFHATMALFTIGVSSSQTTRGKIHNGFWVWKVILLLGLYVCAYSFHVLESFVQVWMILGVVGGIFFVYVQHITLIDFAYELNGLWYAKARKHICYTFCIYLCTVLLYLVTAAAYTLLILFYGLPHQCSLNLAMSGINGGFTILLAICSIFSNTLQRKQLWLPGAVTSAFVAFLTWTALNSQPQILSSDVPWQKRAVSNMDKQQNVSFHPLLVVANHLNRILSDQFASDTPISQPGSITTTSSAPTVMINRCLPSGIGSMADHLGKDIFTFFGMILVIGGSLYSSFRTTMQARRLGIRTKREKLKSLLAPIPEYPEPVSTPIKRSRADDSTTGCLDSGDPMSVGYLSNKEVKRQERALNMLADAVAHLPDPKIFRRPSVHQPNAIQQPSSSHATSDQRKNEQPGPRSFFAPSKVNSQGNVLNTRQMDVGLFKSTLRVSSSVPDLSNTLRRLSKNARQRVDIRDVEWNVPGDSRRSSIPANQPLNSLSRRRSKTYKESIDLRTNRFDEHLEPILNQLHSKPSKTSKRRPDTKRFPSRQPKRKPLESVSDEETALELARLSPEILPEKVGANFFPTTNAATPLLPGGYKTPAALLPAKRSPHNGNLQPLSMTLLDPDLDYSVSACSPNHLRYRFARSASDIVLSKRGSRILQSQPNLAASFAFLRSMLNIDAPRDEYLIYNETIASVYSYPWFHFIYALATLYLMTQLTNWFNPEISNVETLSGSWANMWMRLTSSWIALLLYAWTIACPRFCIGRKLGETPLTPRTPPTNANIVLPV